MFDRSAKQTGGIEDGFHGKVIQGEDGSFLSELRQDPTREEDNIGQ